MKKIIMVIFLLAMPNLAICANIETETGEQFLSRLYKEYITQYVQNIYWYDKKEILAKYFDNELTKLFMKDEECKVKTHEICKIDFDPILDAQDYDDKHKNSIQITKSNNKYKVIIDNISKREILYVLIKTKTGYKINDIIYSGGQSLKAQLK